jgi:hypothetical protein
MPYADRSKKGAVVKITQPKLSIEAWSCLAQKSLTCNLKLQRPQKAKTAFVNVLRYDADSMFTVPMARG